MNHIIDIFFDNVNNKERQHDCWRHPWHCDSEGSPPRFTITVLIQRCFLRCVGWIVRATKHQTSVDPVRTDVKSVQANFGRYAMSTRHVQTSGGVFTTPPWNLLIDSLNYIKELGLKDTLWKRERSTQLDFPTNISLMPPISTWKGEGFYVELFLICAFLLE